MKVALLCNLRPTALPPGASDDVFEEYDSPETIAQVARALAGLGVDVEPVTADARLPWRLEDGHFDFAFNLAEGQGRRCREAIPAAICEMLDLPFTGSDLLTLALSLDKAVARRVVSPEVPVARAVFIEDGEFPAEAIAPLRYPVLVKPNDEGSSKGIRRNALAANVDEAREGWRRLHAQYRCPVLVEEFVPGMEITVGIAGNVADARVIGAMEIAPAAGENPFVYSLEVKRDFRHRVRYHIPPRLDPQSLHEVEQLALAAYRLLGCRDIARLDFRLDAEGAPRFLECNPLPGLHPESGDIVILSRDRLSYDELVQGILRDAARRHGIVLP